RGLLGSLVYRRAEHSFDFEPAQPPPSLGRTSLQYGTLQMEVALPSKVALYVWGYHPQESWQEATVSVPAAQPGLLEVRDTELRPGVSLCQVKVGEWRTTNDVRTGWVRFGGPNDGEARYCEFGA